MSDKDEFDLEDLRYYRSLSAKQKLEHLEKMNRFLLKITPEKAREEERAVKKRRILERFAFGL